jgi:hypothetical protein
MKYFAAISMLALATMAAASPTLQARNGASGGGSGSGSGSNGGGSGGISGSTGIGGIGNSPTCNSIQQQSVCCSSSDLLSLTCLVDLLGEDCSGGTYCCDNGASTVSYRFSHIFSNWKTLTIWLH